MTTAKDKKSETMTTSSAQLSSNPEPERTAQKSRILSPDIARGLALLGIALANVATGWLPADPLSPASSLGGIVDDTLWEKIAAVISAMFIHVRGLPMFSTMLGYGVGMIVLSLWRRNYPIGKARGVLVRRYGFLALFGIVHMILLFWGDIMFFYGVAGMIFATLMTFKDKTLWWFAGVMATLSAVSSIIMAVAIPLSMDPAAASANFSMADLQAQSYGEYLLMGLLLLLAQVAAVPMEIIMLMPVMIVGYIAARHRVLSRVDEFKKPLWVAVWVAVAVAVLIGLPWGLAEIGVLPQSWAATLSGLNQAFGALTGPGIAASIALVVQPLQRKITAQAERGETIRVAWPVRMIAALGARSMSGYVGQSILLLIFTQPFTLGVGTGGGILVSSAVAFGVWAMTVFIAFALELAGRRGPFESLHRYVAYGRKGLQDPYIDPRNRQQLAPGGTHPIPGAQPVQKPASATPPLVEQPGTERDLRRPDNPYRQG